METTGRPVKVKSNLITMKCLSNTNFSFKNNPTISLSYIQDLGNETTTVEKDVVQTYTSKLKNKNSQN